MRAAPGTAALARAALVRAVVLAALWWAVSEGAAGSLGLAAAVVTAATATSLWLQPPGSGSPRLRRLPGFLGWFVARSALGGVDVARRALRRRVDVDPGTVDVAVRLPEGLALVSLADAVSLLPGTLAVELLPGAVRLHVLDVRAPVAEEVAELERRLADLYGVDPA